MFKFIYKIIGYKNTFSKQDYADLFHHVGKATKSYINKKRVNLPLLETRPGLLFSRSHDAPIRSNTDFEEFKPKN